jgi:hypothetical protein
MHLFSANADPDEIVRLDERATRLSPYDAQYWANLGAAQEWAGHASQAGQAFDRAQQLFPNSPDINWRLANFDIRSGKIGDGLRALHRVLVQDSVADGVAPRDVFALARSATTDNQAILDLTVPPRVAVTLDYLNFLSDIGDVDSAEQVWPRLLQLKLPFDFHRASPYLNALIEHRQLEQLEQAWSALADRFPGKISRPSAGTHLITNGGFESEILNLGLDWRVVPVEGVVVTLDSTQAASGTRSLRIQFDGTRNIYYTQVFQFVPVRAGTAYRFTGSLRLEGITTDSGPRFEIYDAYDMGHLFVSTRNMTGTSGWSLQQAEVQTKADTQLLIVRVARPLSHKLDNQIAGTVWVDDVRLEPVK